MVIVSLNGYGLISLVVENTQVFLDDSEAENLAIQLMGAIIRKATLIKTENQVSLEFNREDY